MGTLGRRDHSARLTDSSATFLSSATTLTRPASLKRSPMRRCSRPIVSTIIAALSWRYALVLLLIVPDERTRSAAAEMRRARQASRVRDVVDDARDVAVVGT